MPSPIAPDVVYRLTTVSSPSLSPDGTALTFARTKVDEASMEPSSQLMMMALPDGVAIPYTRGPKDSAPKYSPDGSTIAFLRQDDEGRRQLWVIAVAGGEARQVTRVPGGVVDYCWSSDASKLAFVSDVDPDTLLEDHDAKANPRVRVATRIKYRADGIGWRGDAHYHLFVTDLEGAEPRQLTSGDWDDSGPVWSPDGECIAFVSGRSEDRDFVPYTEAYTVPAAGGELTLWSEGLSSVGAITWSPDSRSLALIASDDESIESFWQGWVFLLEPGKLPQRLTDDSIKPVVGYGPAVPALEMHWANNGRILFLGDSRGQSYLYEVRSGSGAPSAVAGGSAQFSAVSFAEQGGRAIVVAASPTSPGDLLLIDHRSGETVQLTHFNRDYFDQHPTARLEKFSVVRDDVQSECRLLLPPEFSERNRYPLIVDIHGGPHGAFYDSFNAIQQVLATAGYIVLCVNPRGSSTYGAEFAKAVLGDWGGEDYLDIMAAVEEVCARPYVDATRLGLHGYSYGGYMSAWIVGQDDRFGAAVVGGPCTDLRSMYGTSDIGVSFGERQWGGGFLEAEAALRERSPITYAHKVGTPVLLLHGEDDLRCPIEQSEQYFVALKRLGKQVEFVRFPGSSHQFLRAGQPRLREEYLGRALGWFEQHLKAAEKEDVGNQKLVTADD